MLLIKDGKILTMENKEYEKASILIENGKIKAIGEKLEAPNAKVINAEGKYVLPGLIDAHTHLGLAGTALRWEGNDVNEINEPITSHIRTIDAINVMDESFQDVIELGVTAVASSPGSANVICGAITAIKTA